MGNDSDRKADILALLSKEGEMVFSRIAFVLRINNYYAQRYLQELTAEGKVRLRQEGTFKYYSLIGTESKEGESALEKQKESSESQ